VKVRFAGCRSFLGFAGALALAGCGSPDVFLEVIVPIDAALPIDQLRFTLTSDGLATRSATGPDPRKLLELEATAGFSLPREYADAIVAVEVEAFVGGVRRGVLVARGEGGVVARRGELVRFTVAMTPTFLCGDGAVEAIEACDDGNTVSGDGCDGACAIEPGYLCEGAPSVCSRCGDGRVTGAERCDDGNAASGDGCDGSCATERGYACAGMPSVCVPTCGDGYVVGDEECDDGALVGGDGCSASCVLEVGWTCDDAEPTTCVPICGDGLIVGPETCDDRGLQSVGCGADCRAEPGYVCAGAPSVCFTECGDGIVAGAEVCDDGPDNQDDMPDACRTDCTLPFCGDLVVDTTYGETCDDGNTNNHDGCLTGCRVPSCGDGFLQPGEQCDDGNNWPGDGCDSSCQIEDGYECGGAPTHCGLAARTHVVSPAGGDFTTLSAAVQSSKVLAGDLLLVASATYQEDVAFTKSLTVVGAPGAALQSTANNAATLTVRGGATVFFQGFIVASAGRGQPPVSVRDLGSRAVLVDVTLGPSTGVGVLVGAGAAVELRRALVTGNQSGGLDVSGSYTIENSVLRQNGGNAAKFHTNARGTFRFNTVTANASGVVCEAATAITSSILFSNGRPEVQGACDPSTSLVGADPSFAVDGFHLNPGSIAIDAAGLACPVVDFDNDPRPIGAACDMGADERP
jgi:cysteine-rich repeat protein